MHIRFRQWAIPAVLAIAVVLMSRGPASAAAPDQRLARAAVVFQEIMGTPDRGIPKDLLRHAQCIAIIPGMKRVGMGFGGDYGRGIVTCRANHAWSAPLFLTLGGGSFGLQLGAQETDLILLIMNQDGAHYLLKDKFALGGDMEATAGPVGRSADAETDALMHAELLAYSRSRGLFGGITLKGGVIKQDKSANEKFYGGATTQAIISGKVGAPQEARPLLSELNNY